VLAVLAVLEVLAVLVHYFLFNCFFIALGPLDPPRPSCLDKITKK
jgi:hypothetical protein